jgi:hypothetical protein
VLVATHPLLANVPRACHTLCTKHMATKSGCTFRLGRGEGEGGGGQHPATPKMRDTPTQPARHVRDVAGGGEHLIAVHNWHGVTRAGAVCVGPIHLAMGHGTTTSPQPSPAHGSNPRQPLQQTLPRGPHRHNDLVVVELILVPWVLSLRRDSEPLPHERKQLVVVHNVVAPIVTLSTTAAQGGGPRSAALHTHLTPFHGWPRRACHTPSPYQSLTHIPSCRCQSRTAHCGDNGSSCV